MMMAQILGLRLTENINFYRYRSVYKGMLTGEPSLTPCHEHQCMFIHIPKTGGKAVSDALFGGRLLGGHRGCQIYKHLFKDSYSKYFKFSIVRNPWDRLVSAYTFLEGGGLNKADADWAEQNIRPYANFEGFVCHWLTKRNVYSGIHFIPQHEFVTNLRGGVDLDFIGRYENLEQDFEYIKQKVGLPKAQLRQLNRSQREGHYRDYYNDHTRKIVRNVYRRDIKLFGYDF